jgi:type IV secretory pathway VirB3-like protein
MIDTRAYSRTVHRSLLQRELTAGVPFAGLMIVLFLGLVFIYGLEMYYMAVPVVLLYFIMRFLTSKDPWMIDIILENVRQKDVYLP